jgi:hypothetical protein
MDVRTGALWIAQDTNLTGIDLLSIGVFYELPRREAPLRGLVQRGLVRSFISVLLVSALLLT